MALFCISAQCLTHQKALNGEAELVVKDEQNHIRQEADHVPQAGTQGRCISLVEKHT